MKVTFCGTQDFFFFFGLALNLRSSHLSLSSAEITGSEEEQLCFVFETGSHGVALPDLEFTIYTRLALNSEKLCLCQNFKGVRSYILPKS